MNFKLSSKLHKSASPISNASSCKHSKEGKKHRFLVSWASVPLALKLQIFRRINSGKGLLNLPNIASISSCCKLHPSEPFTLTSFKAGNSGNDRPSASAVTDVSFTLRSFTSSRVLFAIAANSRVTESSEHSARLPIFNNRKANNSGSDWLSAFTAADVRFILRSFNLSRVLCLMAATKLVTAWSEQSIKPLMLRVCKADSSGSNWPSASATGDVKRISLSVSSVRVLCLIAAYKDVAVPSQNSSSAKLHMLEVCKSDNLGSDWPCASSTDDIKRMSLRVSLESCADLWLIYAAASSEQLTKQKSNSVMFSNLGNKNASFCAPFDVKAHFLMDKEHLRGFATCSKIWHKVSSLCKTWRRSKWLQCLIISTRPSKENLVEEQRIVFKNFRHSCPELKFPELEGTAKSTNSRAWSLHNRAKCVM